MSALRTFLLGILSLVIAASINFTALAQQVLLPDKAEAVFDAGTRMPDDGWQPVTLPLTPLADHKTVWLKLAFDRTPFGLDSLALSIDRTTERFDAFINGQPLYRNYTNVAEQNFASFQPYFIAIPADLLNLDQNTLTLRLDTDTPASLLLEGLRVGTSNHIKQHYGWRYFAQYLGPQLANAVLAALTLFVFAFWMMRRSEMSLGWLSAIGLLWVVRNLHYALAQSPIPPGLLWESIDVSTFLLLFCLAGFAVSYFRFTNARLILISAAAVVALAIVARYLGSFASVGRGPFAALLPAGVLAVAVLYVLPLRNGFRFDRIVMLAAFGATAAAIVYDTGQLAGWWRGFGFALLPYASLAMFAAFAISVVRRILTALTAKENLSQVLGQRVETTKANLIASESARRSLEISNAITNERERMMREIHDGIGSSLVAALASAERQGRSSSTAVVALKSALTDLRIAVDSLEPVEGNVTTLLANLRYRLEPEMKKANIAFSWQVDDVPELPWLDSPNALHVLRIFQEAFGNILGHANATKITVACRQEMLDGRPGIHIDVSDDGEGFDPAIPPRGRGRKNMHERAEALGGRLSLLSAPGAGSSTVLWLPITRNRITN